MQAQIETTKPIPRMAAATEAVQLSSTDNDALLNSRQARALFGGVTTMSFWRWQRDERLNFPRPVKINRLNYWKLGDLRRFAAERTAASQ